MWIGKTVSHDLEMLTLYERDVECLCEVWDACDVNTLKNNNVMSYFCDKENLLFTVSYLYFVL